MKESKTKSKKAQSRREYQQANAPKKKRVPDSAHARRQQNIKLKKELARKKRPRRRIFPIWLRIIFIAICCIVALAAGLMIGFGVIGDGVPSDALKRETWQHIIDFVTKD